MKLCALTQSYAPTGGGVRTMLHAQRDWCRDHDVEHIMIVPGPEDTVSRDGPLTTYTVASPLLPGSTAYRLLYRSRRVLGILRDELPDVIEVHCAYNLPWTALWHRRRHPAIVSGVYMTDLPVAYVETPLRTRVGRRIASAARRITERYVRALYSRCDVVIAISPAMRDRLVGLGLKQAMCVPLGVDLDVFTPERRSQHVRARLSHDVRARLWTDSNADPGADPVFDAAAHPGRNPGADDHALVLVYAGRLDSEKRPDIVFDAFDMLPPDLNARLVIVGDGPMREALERRAAANPGVCVLPFIDDRTELAALLASADIYVSAMAHETFGLSVVEAQACGLPVVGVRAGAMTDRVVEGSDGFLVEPGSAAEMAQRIAATPRSEWRVMGARARARVEAEFPWRRTFETLLGIYRTR